MPVLYWYLLVFIGNSSQTSTGYYHDTATNFSRYSDLSHSHREGLDCARSLCTGYARQYFDQIYLNQAKVI